MSDLPDGLAHNKQRLFQVNSSKEGEPPVIFEFYTEYGTEGVVTIVIEGEPFFVPVEALLAFASHWQEITKP